jgi:AcrR family transcriptional regulator
MAEISRRAGVGMATLYRNFPRRRELLEELFIDEVDAICEAAASADGQTADAAVFGESRARVLAALDGLRPRVSGA